MAIKGSKLNERGEIDPRLDASDNRIKLLLRVVNKEEFLSQWYSGSTSQDMLANHWDITKTDVQNLSYYWCLPSLNRSSGPRKEKVDKLAERVWEVLEHRLDHKMNLMYIQALNQMEQKVEERVAELVAKELE